LLSHEQELVYKKDKKEKKKRDKERKKNFSRYVSDYRP
jgi:hypothetical protein